MTLERSLSVRQHPLNLTMQRSENSNLLVCAILEAYREEGLDVPYTMGDFKRDYLMENFKELTLEERWKALQRLPAHELDELEKLLRQRREAAPSAAEQKPARRKGRKPPKS